MPGALRAGLLGMSVFADAEDDSVLEIAVHLQKL